MESNVEKAVITIGLPVYNGEKTIKNTLNSILEQTFTDYQVIISDNNSTDNTAKICQEYSKKNSRITYFRQNENIGILNNFNYVLNYANSEYFVWLAADDWWEPTFLEKNISVLNSNKIFVGSISRVEYFGEKKDHYLVGNEVSSDKFRQKMKIRSYTDYPINPSYEERMKFYLIFGNNENVYAVFRTEKLKKSYLRKEMAQMDGAILLKVLKFGDINIIDKVLMHRSSMGMSLSFDLAYRLNQVNGHGLIGKIFPYLPFTFWCTRELGIKILIKNLEYFIRLNIHIEKYLLRYWIDIAKKNLGKFIAK